MRAGVVEILTLQNDASTTGVGGESRHFGQDAGTTGIISREGVQLLRECGIDAGFIVSIGQLVDCRNQSFGDKSAAVLTEIRAGSGLK